MHQLMITNFHHVCSCSNTNAGSQWGSCGTSAAYCGDCCQNGASFNSPGTPAPSKSPSATTGSTVTTTLATTTTTSTSSIGNLVLNAAPRCGFSEIDAREHCKETCATDADCEVDGEFCYVVHSNYCGSIPQRIYEQPQQSLVVSRCGISEEMARTFCGEECSWQCSNPGESCIAVSLMLQVCSYCLYSFFSITDHCTSTSCALGSCELL